MSEVKRTKRESRLRECIFFFRDFDRYSSRKIKWDLSQLPTLKKNFYQESEITSNRPDVRSLSFSSSYFHHLQANASNFFPCSQR